MKNEFGIRRTVNRVSLILAVLFLGGASSCRHDPPIVEVNTVPIDTTQAPPAHIIEFGQVSLKKNGISWTPPPPFVATYYGGNIRFSLIEESLNAYQGNDLFGISDIPCSKGVYTIQNFHLGNKSFFTPEALFAIFVGGDEPSGSYTVDTDTTRHDHNFIEIIDYNAVDSTVEGRFQTYLFRDPLGPPSQISIPDSVIITEGKFYLKIHRH
jgi:hypothetical protein